MIKILLSESSYVKLNKVSEMHNVSCQYILDKLINEAYTKSIEESKAINNIIYGKCSKCKELCYRIINQNQWHIIDKDDLTNEIFNIANKNYVHCGCCKD